MPLYWFHIDTPAQPHDLTERFRSVVRAEPGVRENFQRMWRFRKPTGPPFIGYVRDDSFKLRRDIRGRNSFLPRIRGRIIPTHTGTRINIIMFIHPLSALFMTFWLGAVGYGAIRDTSAPSVVLWGMFLFGVSLIAGCFFPEALKAKRLLRDVVLGPNEKMERSSRGN
jgi:hypothetical protein